MIATQFTGKERDSETGLDNFGARHYGSSMGRFMSPDPLGGHMEDPQTLNKYSYVRNNPLSLTDPTGLDFNLTCQKESATCQGGVQGTTTTDANGKSTFTATVISNDKNGGLVDQNGNQYNATVTGAGVQFSQAGSNQSSLGVFVNGTNATTIQGSGDLAGFTFNFTYSNMEKNQTAGGTFTFNGTADQAGSALENAGFTHHWLDTFDWNHPSTESYDAIDYRSPASRPDGSGSGHMTVHSPVIMIDRWRIPLKNTVPVSGDLHLGEHNPFSLNGIIGHIKEQ